MEDNLQEQNVDRSNGLWLPSAAAAFAVILLFFILSNFSGGRRISSTVSAQDYVTDLSIGDWTVKTYTLAGGISFRQQVDPEKALASYGRAARKGSPSGARRMGVLAMWLGMPQASRDFSLLTSKAVLAGRPKQDVADLKSEAAMWQDILHSKKLAPAAAKSYESRIDKLNLGPTKPYALARLYQLSGQQSRIPALMTAARDKALYSVVPGSLLSLVMFGAGAAGLVLIIVFISRRREPAEPAAPRLTDSWVLLQAFTIYVGIFVAMSFLSGALFRQKLLAMEADQRLLYIVMLEFALSAATGLLGLGVLLLLVRKHGGRPSDIGLTTKDFGRNVLWGIGGYCALLPLLYAAAMVSNVLFRNVKTPPHPIFPMLMSGNSTVFLMLFITGAMLAPFFEEIFFRGLLFRGLRARMTVAGAALLSAAGFAIIHPQLPAGFLPIFAIGAVFAVLAETRQSLVPSMVAHALNNGIIFLGMYFLVLS